MSYKRKLLTIGSTVMLTAGLVTLTQLDAQKVEAREEVGEEKTSTQLRGETTKGFKFHLDLENEAPIGLTNHLETESTNVIWFSLKNGETEGDFKKVTITDAHGNVAVGGADVTQYKTGPIWNNLDIRKGDQLTIMIDDDPSNTAVITSDITIKGTVTKNCNIPVTIDGKTIIITSITKDYIRGYGQDIPNDIYFKNQAGEMIADVTPDSRKLPHVFQMPNSFNLTKGETVTVGQFKYQKENEKGIEKFHGAANAGYKFLYVSPKEHDITSFEAPQTVQGSQVSSIKEIELSKDTDQYQFANNISGKITKITPMYIEGKVDAKFKGRFIAIKTLISIGPGQGDTRGWTGSKIGPNGEFKLFNSVPGIFYSKQQAFGRLGTQASYINIDDGNECEYGTSQYEASIVAADQIDSPDLLKLVNLFPRKNWGKGYYNPDIPGGEVEPVYVDADKYNVFPKSNASVLVKDTVTVEDIKNAITIKDWRANGASSSYPEYPKDFQVELDQSTVPVLENGEDLVTKEVEGTVIYADGSKEQFKVEVTVTSKTDAELYTKIYDISRESVVTAEHLNYLHIQGEINDSTIYYDKKVSVEILDGATLPVLPENPTEDVSKEMKVKITYADNSTVERVIKVTVRPTELQKLQCDLLWPETEGLLKDVDSHNNIITGKFIAANAKLELRIFSLAQPPFESFATTDENGNFEFKIEDRKFPAGQHFNIILFHDDKRTGVSDSFELDKAIKPGEDNGGGEVDPTPDPEKPVDPDNGGGTDNGNGGEIVNPTPDPEKPVDPDNGGGTDNGNGGEVDPTPDPEKPVTPTNKTGWDGDYYYKDGEKVTSKWIYDKDYDNYFYVDATGHYKHDTWEGGYYLNGNGEVAKSQWIYDKAYKNWFKVDENGHYKHDVWEGGYWLNANGEVAKSQWIYDKAYDNWFKVDENGHYKYHTWEGGYYLNGNGEVAKSQWIYDKAYENWFKVDENGHYKHDAWEGGYWLNTNGEVAKSQWIYDKAYENWFKVDENGHYLHDLWVGEYYLESNGEIAHNK